MARNRRHKRRGVSAGTVFVLALCALVFAAGGYIYQSLSGELGQIRLDTTLLTQPLLIEARSVTDTEPSIQRPQEFPEVEGTGGLSQLGEAPAATPAPTPTPQKTRNFTLTAMGQVTIGSELRAAAKDADTGALSFASMFAPIATAIPANLSIATLRTALTDDASAYETYRAPGVLAADMKARGVTLFNLATDRLLDYGTAGVTTTRNVLRNASASTAGAYDSAEERMAYSTATFDGLKVGLLSYTTSISAAGKQAATDTEAGIATRLLTLEGAQADIRALRENGAEVVIVLAHWGNRSDTKPSADTRKLADALIDAGADIILGTNPTQVHEFERRTVLRDGVACETFIAYSLGNLLIDDSRDTPNITGVILHLGLEWSTERKSLSVKEAWYMPTWIMRWKDIRGINRYRIVPAGVSSLPDGMTETVYANMKKAHQSMITRLGSEAATPKAE